MESSVLTPQEVRRWTRVGVLAALSMLLGYAETFVPIPIPGIKLGLANIAVLAALATDDVAGAFCISLIKVLAAGLLFGSPLTMAYSAAGTLLAFVGMAPLSKLPNMHIVMVSVVGALLHEVGQLALASMLLGTTVVWYTAPILLLAGCATGVLCGVLASRLDESLLQEDLPDDKLPQPLPTPPSRETHSTHGLLLLGLLVVIVAILRLDTLWQLALCATASVVVCFVTGVTAKTLARSLRPMALIAAVTLVAQLMVAPQTALVESARSLLRLMSIATLCLAFMTCIPTDDLTATVRRIVLPLRCIGVRTDGFILAFDVALRLVPTMGTIIEPGDFRLRDIPHLVPQAYARLQEEALRRSETGSKGAGPR